MWFLFCGQYVSSFYKWNIYLALNNIYLNRAWNLKYYDDQQFNRHSSCTYCLMQIRITTFNIMCCIIFLLFLFSTCAYYFRPLGSHHCFYQPLCSLLWRMPSCQLVLMLVTMETSDLTALPHQNVSGWRAKMNLLNWYVYMWGSDFISYFRFFSSHVCRFSFILMLDNHLKL